jgi:NADH-quinone oxidoreductase subunit G
MNAHHGVNEPKPPEDPDSPLSYTMEGLRAIPPSSMIPFFWSPGWNSVQSVNKYQEEIGAALRGGDPGLRLLKPSSRERESFRYAPEAFRPLEDRLMVIPLHHIFGSEELSTRSKAIASRLVEPYVLISLMDSKHFGLNEGQLLSFSIDHEAYQLPVMISEELQEGLAGIPTGLDSLPFAELPAWAVLHGIQKPEQVGVNRTKVKMS